MKFIKKISVIMAAVLAAGTMSACASSEIGDYATTEVAKYGSESIKLAEANFWLRYEQMTNEAYYGYMWQYFGYDNMWDADSGDGTTQGEAMHTEVMKQIRQMRVLNDHIADYGVELTDAQKEKIASEVADFLESYPNFADYCDASAEEIQVWMETNSTACLVAEAVKDAAEINIEDSSVEAYRVDYITFEAPAEEETEEAGEEAETEEASETEEEPADTRTAEEKAQAALEMAQAGQDMETIAESFDTTNSHESYLVTGEESTDIQYTASQEMEAGEAQIVQDGDDWLLIVKANDLDEDETEERREEAIDEQQTEAFNTTYTEWEKSSPKFKVNEKIWSQVTITDMIYEEPTEAYSETEAAETEAAE